MTTPELEIRLAEALAAGSAAGGARLVSCELEAEGRGSGVLAPANADIIVRLSYEVSGAARAVPALRFSLTDGRGVVFWSVCGLQQSPGAGFGTVEMRVPGRFLALGPYVVSGAILQLDGAPGLLAGPVDLVSFAVVEERGREGSARGPQVVHENGLARPPIPWSLGDLDEARGAPPKPVPKPCEVADAGTARLVSLRIADPGGGDLASLRRGQNATLEMVWELDQPCVFAPSFAILDERGVNVMRFVVPDHTQTNFVYPASLRYGVVWLPTHFLRPGRYTLEVSASDPRSRPLYRYFREFSAARFELVAADEASGMVLGPVCAPVTWSHVEMPAD